MDFLHSSFEIHITISRCAEMSSIESFNRGSMVAVPDPATFYRRRICASVGGGSKRHPGKAILAGGFANICNSRILSVLVLVF